MLKFYAATIPILLALTAAVVRAEDVRINRDCDNGAPMLEINQCAGFKFTEVDGQMNELYKEKIAATRSAASKKRLRDAQRAWIAFRDKACLYEAGPEKESGSSWPFHQFGCMEFYTKRRIQDLQAYLKCTTDDCP